MSNFWATAGYLLMATFFGAIDGASYTEVFTMFLGMSILHEIVELKKGIKK